MTLFFVVLSVKYKGKVKEEAESRNQSMGDSVSDASGCFLVKTHFLKVVPVVSLGSREKISLRYSW